MDLRFRSCIWLESRGATTLGQHSSKNGYGNGIRERTHACDNIAASIKRSWHASKSFNCKSMGGSDNFWNVRMAVFSCPTARRARTPSKQKRKQITCIYTCPLAERTSATFIRVDRIKASLPSFIRIVAPDLARLSAEIGLIPNRAESTPRHADVHPPAAVVDVPGGTVHRRHRWAAALAPPRSMGAAIKRCGGALPRGFGPIPVTRPP